MKVREKRVTLKDLFSSYLNDEDLGVTAYGGNLNVRPSYQREFIYPDAARDEVVKSVLAGLPINGMYWALNEDGTWELVDGQQRSLSLLEFMNGGFSVNHRGYANLSEEERAAFDSYELCIWVCVGTHSEKLKWFEIINKPGLKLTTQELRNGAYPGPFLESAKEYFSKRSSPAQDIGGKYLGGKALRQDHLQYVLKWISGKNIEQYMADHQHDNDAIDLWEYFVNVIEWTKKTFPKYRSEMKGVDWGLLYNDFKDAELDVFEIENEVSRLFKDEDVTSRKGVFDYVLTGNEKSLNIRKFTELQKSVAFERQNGVCPKTGKKFESYKKMHADHVTAWSNGGKTVQDNLELVCPKYNLSKSNKF